MVKTYHDAATIIQTAINADIEDAIGVVRYRISLQQYKNNQQETRYSIEIFNMFILDEENKPTLLHRYDSIVDLNEAKRIYDKNVEDYTNIVKAEVIYIEDINLYKDEIDYKPAKCCKNCIFSRLMPKCHHLKHMPMLLKCHNPILFEKDKNNKLAIHEIKDLQDDLIYGDDENEINARLEEFWNKNKLLYKKYPGNFENLNLHPTVDPFWTCNFFRPIPKKPIYSEDIKYYVKGENNI